MEGRRAESRRSEGRRAASEAGLVIWRPDIARLGIVSGGGVSDGRRSQHLEERRAPNFLCGLRGMGEERWESRARLARRGGHKNGDARADTRRHRWTRRVSVQARRRRPSAPSRGAVDLV